MTNSTHLVFMISLILGGLGTKVKKDPIQNTTLYFGNLKMTIYNFSSENEPKELRTNGDTIVLYSEVYHNIEEKSLRIETESLENIELLQGYRSWPVVSVDGPYCELEDWKNNSSPFIPCKKLGQGKYSFIPYQEDELEIINNLDIKIDELIEQVESACPEDGEFLSGFTLMVKELKSTNRTHELAQLAYMHKGEYYLKIKAQHKENGKSINYFIVIKDQVDW